jgi:hypothetical protein
VEQVVPQRLGLNPCQWQQEAIGSSAPESCLRQSCPVGGSSADDVSDNQQPIGSVTISNHMWGDRHQGPDWILVLCTPPVVLQAAAGQRLGGVMTNPGQLGGFSAGGTALRAVQLQVRGMGWHGVIRFFWGHCCMATV